MAVDEVVGTDQAFEELYTGYADNVFRYALTVLGQQADAEDATQTTFLNAYRALQRGERPQQPERWLITIAHNTCRQRYRYAQRRPREVSLDEALTIAGIEESERPTAEELKQALMHLPSAQRSALVMRELEGRSYAEAAAALQISDSALESLLFRARESLREQLAEPLSCRDAARAISMQLDGTLPDRDRRVLRAHLRTCEECATLARSRRAQKRMLPGLLGLPAWIGRLFPGGLTGASATGGVGAAGLVLKTAAIVAVGAVVGGGVYEGTTHAGPVGVRSALAHDVSRAPTSQRSASLTTQHLSATSTNGSPSSHAGAAPAGLSAPASASTPVPSDPAAQSIGATSGAQGGPATAAVRNATSPSTAVGSIGAATGTAAAAPSGSQAAGAVTLPPGQAKKLTTADTAAASPAAKVPPGQAEKAKAATPADTASATVPAASPAPSVAPGQAKKDANATPTDPSSSTTAPAPPQDTSTAKNVASGQAKKSGSGH